MQTNHYEIFQVQVFVWLWFGQEKAKSILFGTKHKLQNTKALNNVYDGREIKQYEKVKYLGCILNQSLSGESMAFNVIDKVNFHLKFLQDRTVFKHHFLIDFNVMHWFNLFDYACTAWFSNLSEIL